VDLTHPDLKANLAKPPGISVLNIDSNKWPSMRKNASWYLGVSRLQLAVLLADLERTAALGKEAGTVWLGGTCGDDLPTPA
jgi:hypothetical protein